MNWRRSLNLSLAGCVALLLTMSCTSPPKPPFTAVTSPVAAQPNPTIDHKTYTLPRSVVHVITIPAGSHYSIMPIVANTLATVEEFAQRTDAISVINGSFFDPQNAKSTSYVTIQGEQVADPHQNERLINNPDLAPYMDKILNRSEFRQYRCSEGIRYDITLHRSPIPTGCELIHALGAGPQLLPQSTAVAEGFIDFANDVVIRDAIGSQQPNARSAIGITGRGQIVLVMAAQKPENPTDSGLTLPELTEFMRSLQVEQAINLDGGSSASLYYQGKIIYGRLDPAGKPVKRPVKSVLFIPKR